MIHGASGARGEGREHRSVTRNRVAAFERLCASKEFKNWHKIECAKRLGRPIIETTDQIKARVDRMVDQGLKDGTVVVEEIGAI